MGVFDKLRNALFEVEYVEVDELPKKEKKEKQKSKIKPIERKKEEKPIAKKIVLPGKKEEKVEHLGQSGNAIMVNLPAKSFYVYKVKK